MPSVNWTIDVSTLLIMAGGIISFMWGAIMVRDSLRDMRASIGSHTPRSGILGTLDDYHAELTNIGNMTRRHRDWLIEINARADDPIRMDRT